MLRLRPTAVRLTPSELKDIENRSRYRRYLRQQQDRQTFAGKVITARGNGAIIQQVKQTEGDQDQEDKQASSQNDQDDHVQSSPDPLQDNDHLHRPQPRPVRRGVLFHHRAESDAGESSSSTEIEVETGVPFPVVLDADRNPRRFTPFQPSGPPSLPPPFSAVPRAMPMPVSGRFSPEDAAISVSSPTQSANNDETDISVLSRPDRIISAIRSLSIRATRGPQRRSPGYGDAEASTMTTGEILAAASDHRSTTPQFPVYNDALPMTTQPRTPRHLPESRHQSRFHGAYTAPAGTERHRRRPNDTPTPKGHRGRQRERSPLGMSLPGFQGLYGGSENAEEET